MSKAKFVELNSADELDRFIEAGKSVVLKHSISCPISHDLYRRVSTLDNNVGLVVVQKARAVSNLLAERTGIRHESPQALVFSDGKCVYSDSHYDIDTGKISELLNGNG